MTAFEQLKQSNIWHKEYDLPLSPQNNNPHFYCALSAKTTKNHGFENYLHYYKKCELAPGLIQRWPVQSKDDVTSHDEIIGACYLHPLAAKEIYRYLTNNDWVYNNTNIPPEIPEAYNLGRIFWFVTYVKHMAGVNVSLLSKLSWCLHLLVDMIKTKKDTQDASGRHLIWVMSEHMKELPICNWTYNLWCWRMNKLGITPKAMLKLEPRENPILSELAPERYE